MNYLEDFVAQWYEYRGFFVRRNVLVGKRAAGGYECELDVVAFHPSDGILVHVEASMDAHSWGTRETRFKRKFDAGRRYIPALFSGLRLPSRIDQIALFGLASRRNRTHVGGARIVLVEDLLADVLAELRDRRIASNAVPEDKPILRTLQYVAGHLPTVVRALQGTDGVACPPGTDPGRMRVHGPVGGKERTRG